MTNRSTFSHDAPRE